MCILIFPNSSQLNLVRVLVPQNSSNLGPTSARSKGACCCCPAGATPPNRWAPRSTCSRGASAYWGFQSRTHPSPERAAPSSNNRNNDFHHTTTKCMEQSNLTWDHCNQSLLLFGSLNQTGKDNSGK